MELPFTHSDFLDGFGAFNTTWWPLVIALWLLTVGVFMRLWGPATDGRVVSGLLAAHWLWSGVVYHWLFFRPINPAASIFSLLFVAQAILFGWMLLMRQGRFAFDRTMRGRIASGLVAYGLLYPLFGLLTGLDYPRLPLFAVPCPTTLITAGLLLASNGLPRVVNIVPILWAAIGSSAAITLGIRADLALIAVGALLTLDAVAPRALGARPTR